MTGAAAHTDAGARLVVLAESLFKELAARVRDFLSTEKGGAVVLLTAATALYALVIRRELPGDELLPKDRTQILHAGRSRRRSRRCGPGSPSSGRSRWLLQLRVA